MFLLLSTHTHSLTHTPASIMPSHTDRRGAVACVQGGMVEDGGRCRRHDHHRRLHQRRSPQGRRRGFQGINLNNTLPHTVWRAGRSGGAGCGERIIPGVPRSSARGVAGVRNSAGPVELKCLAHYANTLAAGTWTVHIYGDAFSSLLWGCRLVAKAAVRYCMFKHFSYKPKE